MYKTRRLPAQILSMFLSLSLPSSRSLSLSLSLSGWFSLRYPPPPSPPRPTISPFRAFSCFSTPTVPFLFSALNPLSLSLSSSRSENAVDSMLVNPAEENCPRCAVPAYVEVNVVLLVQHPVACDIDLDASTEVTFVVVVNNNI